MPVHEDRDISAYNSERIEELKTQYGLDYHVE